MAQTYTTTQGDTWDGIAYKVYGDEKYMRYLYEANWEYSEELIFSSGIVLTVPDLPEETDEDLPFWRLNEDDDDEDTYSETEDPGD